jgi:hypothetical protein
MLFITDIWKISFLQTEILSWRERLGLAKEDDREIVINKCYFSNGFQSHVVGDEEESGIIEFLVVGINQEEAVVEEIQQLNWLEILEHAK